MYDSAITGTGCIKHVTTTLSVTTRGCRPVSSRGDETKVSLARRRGLRFRGRGIGGADRKVYDVQTLTPDALRECLQDEQAIAAAEELHQVDLDALDEVEQEIAQIERTLDIR
jgi:hypothetical protein